MPSEKRQFGDHGEAVAEEYLRQKGYQILDRNFLVKGGELDIVAARKSFLGKLKEIIFVEVKSIEGSGSALDFSLAAQNVHWQKKQHLQKSANIYLLSKKIPPEIPWRIDIMLIAFDNSSGLVRIEHLENAVWGK